MQRPCKSPPFHSVRFPIAIVVLAFLPVVSRLGLDLSSQSAVVMVLAIAIVIVVVVGVVKRLAVLMVLRRVMHVRHFMMVMTEMVPPTMAVCETLFGVEACERRHRSTS